MRRFDTALTRIAQCLFVIFLLVFSYGLYRFPHAPIRELNGRFVDKAGAVHSREDFEWIRSWERGFFTTVAASLVTALWSRYPRRRDHV